MKISALLFLVLLFAAFSYFMARQKITTAYRQHKSSHKILTLPKYFGYVAALCALLPALVVLLFLQMVEEPYINSEIATYISSEHIDANQNLDLYLNEIKSADTPEKVAALSEEKQLVYQRYHEIEQTTATTISVVVLAISILLTIGALKKININTPARKVFEKIIEGILLLAASIAIMTTVGIVFSVLFESTRFLVKCLF